MSKCDHRNLEYVDGMYTISEAPYDSGDFWWSVNCIDCDMEIAEGDGYFRPAWIEAIAKKGVPQMTPLIPDQPYDPISNPLGYDFSWDEGE